MKILVRLIAVWAGMNALVFALLAAHAASIGGTWKYWWVRPGAALLLAAVAGLGGLASIKLWRLTLEGRRLAMIFFGLLAMLYSAKLVLGPHGDTVLVPWGLCVSILGTLAGVTRSRSTLWKATTPKD